MSLQYPRFGARNVPLLGVAIIAALSAIPGAFALPDKLVQDTVASGFNRPVGVAFAPGGGLLVWEKAGRVLYVTPQGQNRLILDLTDEVTLHHGRGLLGLALDPQFAANGHIYIAYTADYAYLIANENENQNVYPLVNPDQPRDTIGRLVRYTVDNPVDPTAMTPGSRVVLLGQWSTRRDPETEALSPPHETDGVPTTAGSHLTNSLRFAADGTLLLGVGDGGIWFTEPDVGELPRHTSQSSNTAESDGILPPKWQVGAFRAQMKDAYNGKILRLDVSDVESNGCRGAPGNPYLDQLDPASPRSMVYALGFRNPYQFAIQPGAGSTDPADGDPGVLYVGDVGWNTWEELNAVTAGGQNFGWPIYEGMVESPVVNGTSYAATQVANLDAPNPLFPAQCAQQHFYFTDLLINDSLNANSWLNPCDAGEQISAEFTAVHRRPAFAYRRDDPATLLPIFDSNGVADVLGIGEPLPPGATGLAAMGTPFAGRSIIVGEFYDADKLPAPYQGALFFGDHIDGWIRYARFDASGNLSEIGEFMNNGEAAQPTAIHVHPTTGDLYYVAHFAGQIRRITTDCDTNGVADDIDLQSTGADCNQTGVLDACEDLSGGDFDADGTVTEEDLDALADCLAGPNQPPTPDPLGCAASCVESFDLDTDLDVDLADFARLAELFDS